MVLLPTNKRLIRPFDKPSFEHTQRHGLVKGHLLSRRLVGYWPLNEGSGKTVFDLSGNGHTGTFQGTAPSWTSGQFGPAVLLPGDDESISLGTSINMAGWTELSVFGWFKPSAGAPDEQVLIGNWDSSTASILVRVDQDSSHLDIFLTEEANTAIGGDTGVDVTFDEWHFVGMTWQAGAKLQGYIDGKAQGNTFVSSAAMDATASPVLSLGRRDPTHGEKLIGPIDNVCLYNRCLSASEVALLYSNPFCMIERGILPSGFVPEAVPVTALYGPDLFKFGYRYIPGEVKVVARAVPDIFKMLSGFVPEAVPVTALYAPDLFKFGYRYIPGEVKVAERAALDIFEMLSGYVPEAVPPEVERSSSCVIHGWLE